MKLARIEIQLVVGGDVVDLNRIQLPPDTPIIDMRFEIKPDKKQAKDDANP